MLRVTKPITMVDALTIAAKHVHAAAPHEDRRRVVVLTGPLELAAFHRQMASSGVGNTAARLLPVAESDAAVAAVEIEHLAEWTAEAVIAKFASVAAALDRNDLVIAIDPGCEILPGSASGDAAQVVAERVFDGAVLISGATDRRSE
jgi:hypothetical protein